MTTEEIAEYLKLNPQTVLRKARAGEIPSFKVGRQFRFSKAVIDEWLASNTPEGLDSATEGKMQARSGIPGLGHLPWGSHLCHFYRTKEDIVEVIIPYITAGLEDREYCVLLAAPPLDEKQAKAAMRKQVRTLDEYLARGQLTIIGSSEFYTDSGTFVAERALRQIVDTHQQALKKGFRATRRSGNTSWVENKDWVAFMQYEEMLNDLLGREQMLSICSYPLDRRLPEDMISILHNHRACLVKVDGAWRIRVDRAMHSQAYQKGRHGVLELAPRACTGLQA